MKKIKGEWHIENCKETGKGECDCVIEMRDVARILNKGYDRGIRKAYIGVIRFMEKKISEGLMLKEVLEEFCKEIGIDKGSKK